MVQSSLQRGDLSGGGVALVRAVPQQPFAHQLSIGGREKVSCRCGNKMFFTLGSVARKCCAAGSLSVATRFLTFSVSAHPLRMVGRPANSSGTVTVHLRTLRRCRRTVPR